ncbi:MAG: hypothetical protein NTU47_09395 [Ignavibacteriales bacterium]|nr:hypothetical protein [Ignavibacteriales bacterium]
MSGFKKQLLVVAAFVLTGSQLPAQEHLAPGIERWAIKTSLPPHSKKRNVPVSELLALPNPIEKEDALYDTTRIPATVGPHALKEGDIITTKGWLHLVALEDDSKNHRDGDYHIQIRTSADWADSCLVIEVPFSRFVPDQKLAGECDAVRRFIKDNMLKGKEPGTKGNILDHAVYVSIKGQLFFDASHLKGNPRGKRGMKSYTPWEIHPVFSITFAAKPR